MAARSILDDLLELKAFCALAGINTSVPLNVHPGLPASIPGLNGQLRTFLSTHLSAKRFNSGAIMALNQGSREPWLFMSISRNPPVTGFFGPVPSPGLGSAATPKFTQMLSFLDDPNVQPFPSTTNRMALNNNLVIPEAQRRGVSTAVLFSDEPLTEATTIGNDGTEDSVQDEALRNVDIADVIAHPGMSHFFNTDCVSCHTETTRRVIREIPISSVAFKIKDGVPLPDASVIPSNHWNVCNFGWFGTRNVITQRTANETAAVVEFINDTLL